MPELHTECCTRCRGRGVRYFGQPVVSVPCKICHGSGERQFANSPEKRAHISALAKARKVKKLIHNIETFIGEHPHVYTWMNTSNFPFAKKMHEALLRYGSLTDRQLDASLKCVRRET